MTTSLKAVREPPLLNPLGDREYEPWLRVSDDDREMFFIGLKAARGLRDGSKIAQLHYYMRRLGVPTDVTRQDRVELEIALSQSLALEMREVPVLADIMGDIGVPSTLNDYDKKWMAKSLEMARKSADGADILQAHYHLKRSKHPQQVTDEDIGAVRAKLDTSREKNDGEPMAAIYYYASKLGVALDMEPQDHEIMRQSLERLRNSDHLKARDTARMLFHLREIAGKNSPETDQKMPPIRRFGGVG